MEFGQLFIAYSSLRNGISGGSLFPYLDQKLKV